MLYLAFYCKNLENKIFSAHLTDFVNQPDELIIISGYLGPSPVQKLKNLPFKATVIGGMYPNGVNENLFNSLNKSKQENSNLQILFSNIEIHSKIYIWMEKKEPKLVLIGSANFSDSGLKSDYRETLADMDMRNSKQLIDYLNMIKNSSTDKPILINSKTTNKAKKNITTDIINNKTKLGELSVDLPLYSEHNNEVPEKSGLNWGNPNGKGHTALGDAYIPIPSKLEKELTDFFPPLKPNYSFSKKKLSDPIEILWDDGMVMQASLEGKHNIKMSDGSTITYPKQISSYSDQTTADIKYSSKSILGRYIRNRMNIDLNHIITLDDLLNYGRKTITFTKISDGVYSADFSVKKDPND